MSNDYTVFHVLGAFDRKLKASNYNSSPQQHVREFSYILVNGADCFLNSNLLEVKAITLFLQRFVTCTGLIISADNIQTFSFWGEVTKGVLLVRSNSSKKQKQALVFKVLIF